MSRLILKNVDGRLKIVTKTEGERKFIMVDDGDSPPRCCCAPCFDCCLYGIYYKCCDRQSETGFCCNYGNEVEAREYERFTERKTTNVISPPGECRWDLDFIYNWDYKEFRDISSDYKFYVKRCAAQQYPDPTNPICDTTLCRRQLKSYYQYEVRRNDFPNYRPYDVPPSCDMTEGCVSADGCVSLEIRNEETESPLAPCGNSASVHGYDGWPNSGPGGFPGHDDYFECSIVIEEFPNFNCLENQPVEGTAYRYYSRTVSTDCCRGKLITTISRSIEYYWLPHGCRFYPTAIVSRTTTYRISTISSGQTYCVDTCDQVANGEELCSRNLCPTATTRERSATSRGEIGRSETDGRQQFQGALDFL